MTITLFQYLVQDRYSNEYILLPHISTEYGIGDDVIYNGRTCIILRQVERLIC